MPQDLTDVVNIGSGYGLKGKQLFIAQCIRSVGQYQSMSP